MGIFFDEPKYPVIDKAPSFWRTGTESSRFCFQQQQQTLANASMTAAGLCAVGNFNLTDWGVFALCTGGSLPYGWVAGGQRIFDFCLHLPEAALGKQLMGMACYRPQDAMGSEQRHGKALNVHGGHDWCYSWLHDGLPAIHRCVHG